MTYVDGFVVAVPTDKKAEYIAFSEACAPYFKKHGALSIMENWADDVPDGEVTSFPKAVQLQPGETVVLSWVVWPDKTTRERGTKAMMEEMEADPNAPKDMPFDGKRMLLGSFETILQPI